MANSKKSSGTKGRYQGLMPITSKDIGKSFLKWGRKAYGSNGKRECARRLHQKLSFEEIKITPRPEGSFEFRRAIIRRALLNRRNVNV